MDKYRHDAYLKCYKDIKKCIETLANQIGRDELVLRDEDILFTILLLRDASTAAWKEMVNSGSQTINSSNEFLEMMREDATCR